MKTELLSLPGYRLCEYLLVLHPHQDLVDKIAKVKEDFFEKIDRKKFYTQNKCKRRMDLTLFLN